jgi:hypothetical protein
MLFCILALGFEPRLALERIDGAETRIEKIVELILDSKFGIHDLSRLKASKKGEFFRLNMPFELGIDYGCRRFKEAPWSAKKILILEAERYRFQKAISDISGSDIAVHNNDPLIASNEVRNWLAQGLGNTIPGPAAVFNKFTDFTADNYDLLKARGYSDANIANLPVNELIACMRDWLAANPLL